MWLINLNVLLVSDNVQAGFRLSVTCFTLNILLHREYKRKITGAHAGQRTEILASFCHQLLIDLIDGII